MNTNARGVVGLWPVGAVLLLGWTAFCWGFYGPRRAGSIVDAAFVISPLVLVLATLIGWRTRDRWMPALLGWLESHTEAIDNLPLKHLGWWIAGAAGVGLLAELTIIRVHASYFQVFAYFKNVSLLSCFLGLGIGYALGNRQRLLTGLAVPLLACQVLFMHVLHMGGLTSALQNPVSEELSFGIGSGQGMSLLAVYGFLVVVFGINALGFIPLGQLASRLMGRLPKLVAYSWNLAGSLTGILVFNLLSFWWTPPAVWLTLVVLGSLVFLRGRGAAVPSAVAGLIVVAVVGITPQPNHRDVYSPYQKLTILVHRTQTPEVLVSHVYYQRILPLDSASTASDPVLARWAQHYSLPYHFAPEPDRVLIVGAGTGNDVAAAVRHGAGAIDAVEIDPAILTLGQLLHPEDAYQAPNVNAIVGDARAFIRHATDRYDLIVYGLLDSHTLLSGRAGVRLDSYVYTVEGFREARDRLKEGGLICLTFSIIRDELSRKLYLMLQEAFDGQAPVVYRSGYDGGFTYIIGDNMDARSFPPHPRLEDVSTEVANSGVDVDVSTDDWPFFYMPRRQYPSSYVLMILALLGVTVVFVHRFVPGSTAGISGPCFFLGAGFMLVETKSITELALVYGSTWVVIGAVIAGILTMAFLANLVVLQWGTPRNLISYGLLFAALGLGLLITSETLSQLPSWLNGALLTAVLTLPLFFSGLAFSTELARGKSVAIALSSNLLGAMLGGFLEYNSMYFGFRGLYVIAFVMYGLALVFSGRGRPLVAASAS